MPITSCFRLMFVPLVLVSSTVAFHHGHLLVVKDHAVSPKRRMSPRACEME